MLPESTGTNVQKKSIFISWSGEASEKVALALRAWLPKVFHYVDPFMSGSDIGKGVRWYQEISSHLEESDLGIVCLTPENLREPWLLFEAGALAKKVREGRVCTFLWQVSEVNVPAPLSFFQHTKTEDKKDMLSLLRTINKSLDRFALEPEQLEWQFEMAWPSFEKLLQKIPAWTESTPSPPRGHDSDVLNKIYSLLTDVARQVIVVGYDLKSNVTQEVRPDLPSKMESVLDKEVSLTGNNGRTSSPRKVHKKQKNAARARARHRA